MAHIFMLILSTAAVGMSYYMLRWWMKNFETSGYYLNEETGKKEYRPGSDAYHFSPLMVYPMAGFILGIVGIFFSVYALLQPQ